MTTNIGPAQRRKRLSLGVLSLLAGLALGVGAWALGLTPLLRTTAAPLLFGGFTGVFQARAKT